MKKRFKILLLAIFGMALSGMTSQAEDLHGDLDWKVEFNEQKEMNSNFSDGSFEDVLSYMQPGDSARFQITVQNEYATATDWYMTNEVLRSLEDTSTVAQGGAYSYLLTYTNAAGELKTLYNSSEVGGENYLENLQGLHEATDALKNYFFLDTLASGEHGVVQLYVLLDGETQGNDYQDTLAQLKMNFAVELPVEMQEEKTVFRYESKKWNHHVTQPEETVYIDDEETPLIVQTGDETNLFILCILAGVLGILLIIMVWISRRLRKRMKGEIAGILFLLCLAIPVTSEAKDDYFADDYTYTIRIYAGGQGTFADGSDEMIIRAPQGTTIDLSDTINTIVMNPGTDAAGEEIPNKYYAKGIRESGKDNNTLNTVIGPVFCVTKDMDYVVAYAMKGGDVAYTVRYVKKDTEEELLPADTFYGNVGEKPVVAYKYISGFVPQAYSLAKTLQEDVSLNTFTFYYEEGDSIVYRYTEKDGGVVYYDEEGETIIDYVPGETVYVKNGGGVKVIPATQPPKAERPKDNKNDTEATQGTQTGENPEFIDDAEVPKMNTVPEVTLDLDEQVPLASGEGLTVSDGARRVTGIMIAVMAAVILVTLVWFYKDKKKKKNAQSEEKKTDGEKDDEKGI